MPRNLFITPAPFKSSNLALPPSPFSPRLPLTPISNNLKVPSPVSDLCSATKVKADILVRNPSPLEPLHWLWQCHLCSRVYRLGVTRRCLDDGHMFCAGTTTVKVNRKTKKKTMRHQACASEFDYAGWKIWGTWRRSVHEQVTVAEEALRRDADVFLHTHPLVEDVPSETAWFGGAWTKKGRGYAQTEFWKKDCWGTCDYPSECRWGSKYGVQTPGTPYSPPAPTRPATSFEDMSLDIVMPDAPPESSTDLDKQPSIDDLLDSVKRRKRRSGGGTPSPLASHPDTSEIIVQATASTPSSASVLQKAFDDFEIDVRKSFGRAGDLVTSWTSSMRSTVAHEEEKAELFVKGLKVSKKKKDDGKFLGSSGRSI